MSRPVGNTSSSPVEISFDDVEAEQFEAPRAKAQQPSPPAIESWSGQRPLDFGGPEASVAAITGRELEAQHARQAASRQKALKALGGLEGPVAELATRNPDPLGSTPFISNELALGAFGAALHTPAFNDAVALLTPADVAGVVNEQVKKAWPQRSPKEVEQIRRYFMSEIAGTLRMQAAPRLQKLATKMLEDAARSFDKAATDPSEVQRLAARLSEAGSQGDSTVRDLRAGLGLDPDEADVTPEKLTAALQERAVLLRQEARRMNVHAHNTLFRALAEQDVGPLFKQAAGIGERSLLSNQIDAIKDEGERETAKIGYVKLASLVTAAVFTGGMALGGAGLGAAAAGAGVSASMSAPAVLGGWESVDTAKAGESAGTMTAGAGEEARRHAAIETGAAAVSIAASAGASHALHGVVDALAESAVEFVNGLAHGAIEGAVELTVEGGAHALEHVISARGGATGRSALDRAIDRPAQ